MIIFDNLSQEINNKHLPVIFFQTNNKIIIKTTRTWQRNTNAFCNWPKAVGKNIACEQTNNKRKSHPTTDVCLAAFLCEIFFWSPI